ncbi:hypothetical protein Pfo_015467, partial [Paulownia fortunei]
GTLLKHLFRENKITEAQELFRKIIREGPVMIDSALKLFDEMSEKGIRPNVVTYTALICGLCNLSRWREVKVLFKEMIDCKIYPNLLTFSSLIDAFYVLLIMMQKNVVPNVVSYNSLMDGYCLQGRLDEARNIFDSMASKNIAPTIHSYTILINGYCRKMKIDDTMHLFHEMPRNGVKCSSALKLFDELQAAGLKPNFYTYCNLLDGLCKNGHAERALLLLDALDDLPAKGLEPNVVSYNILIKGCCRNGLLEEAKDLLLKMEHASLLPDEVTYNCIIQGNLMGCKYDDAAKFLEEMGAKGFSPNSSTFALLLDLLGKEEANPTLLEMIQKLAPSILKNKN